MKELRTLTLLKMKSISKQAWLATGLGLLSAAMVYWPLVNGQIEMMSFAYFLRCSAGAFAAASLSVFFFKVTTGQASRYVLVGMVLGMVMRIIFDVVSEPTAHNLWPIEIALTVAWAIPGCVLGAFTGIVVGKIGSPKPD